MYLASELFSASRHADVGISKGCRVHVLVELHLYTLFVCTSLYNLRLLVLSDSDVHLQLRRRHRQPFAVCGEVSVLLELHLPESLRHIPTIHTVLVGEQRVLLSVFLSVPHHDILVLVAPKVLHLFLIVDGGLHALHTILWHSLIDVACRVVVDGERVERRTVGSILVVEHVVRTVGCAPYKALHLGEVLNVGSSIAALPMTQALVDAVRNKIKDERSA